MNRICTLMVVTIGCMLYNVKLNAQANTTLSNLVSPTAVNQDLLPATDQARNLGNVVKSWKRLYITQGVYYNDSFFLHGTGTRNAFAGFNSGYAITTGYDNAALGYHTLLVNQTGLRNAAFGSYALSKATVSDNSAFGAYALQSNTAGSANAALGSFALSTNTTGKNNIAVGYAPLFKNTSGSNNGALGFKALYSNTSGYSNIAVGGYALFSNIAGNQSIAIGDSALYNNTASFNVAVGSKALYSNITGVYNTALGYNATVNNTPNSNASAIGSNTYADCSNCIILGSVNGVNGAAANARVGIGISSPGANNSLEIQSTLGTAVLSIEKNAGGNGILSQCNNGSASDYAIWGVANTGYAGVFSGNLSYTGTLSGPSDAKLKENIKLTDNMLDKVMQLKPSQYNFKAEFKKMNLPQGQQIGLIAQDLEKVFPQLVVKAFDKQVDSGKIFEYKAVNYIGLIPVLTKAIQELAKQNDSLKQAYIEKFDAQQKQIDDLKALVLGKSNGAFSLTNATLQQNVPNPFKGSTTISYNLPQQFSRAQLVVRNASGKTIKQINISGSGTGSLNVDASTLAAGAYNYSLIVDGKIIDTKQMISGSR